MQMNSSESEKSEKRHRGTTLQRRLVFLFFGITAVFILAFALLLILFGIGGSEEKNLHTYFDNELTHISDTIYEDFGSLSVTGIRMAETISDTCDDFFEAHETAPGDLAKNPELIEPLLAEQFQTLLNVMGSYSCGGVYMLLDATVKPDADNASVMKAGIFLKKIQPTLTQAVNVKSYYLRGPAQIARNNGIELLGQWMMEYDISNEPFFCSVMETAKENESLPLSRLYYWSGRTLLKGNSEAGFLLCVPLRSSDGTVFGVCGIEISDRLFKQCYSPQESNYKNLFTAVSPSDNEMLFTSKGMTAGNYYLTDNRMTDDLTMRSEKNGFLKFSGSDESYYGKSSSLRLYPSGSPYDDDGWSVAILMPEKYFTEALSGDSHLLFVIISALMLASIVISVLLSRRFLRPVKKAITSIKENSYDREPETTYTEIADLFDFLAQKDKENEEQLLEAEKQLLETEKQRQETEKQRLETEKQRQEAQTNADNAIAELSRLTEKKHREVDPDSYALFCENLGTLTAKEREIFNLYLDGKSAKDIMDLLSISENTLKYHNRNIYGKLGVTSRKELLMYATLMKKESK